MCQQAAYLENTGMGSQPVTLPILSKLHPSNLNMKKSRLGLQLLSACILASALTGLFAAEPTTTKGFRFPGGEAEAGREAFLKLNCVQCHTVAKGGLPEMKAPRRLEVSLGNTAGFVKKYEDIITAITNPKHVIAERYKAILAKNGQDGSVEPLMPDLTKDMSARQLMDIVTYLDEAFQKSSADYAK
jgi:sulfur-oxidizing protein SoxX